MAEIRRSGASAESLPLDWTVMVLLGLIWFLDFLVRARSEEFLREEKVEDKWVEEVKGVDEVRRLAMAIF